MGGLRWIAQLHGACMAHMVYTYCACTVHLEYVWCTATAASAEAVRTLRMAGALSSIILHFPIVLQVSHRIWLG